MNVAYARSIGPLALAPEETRVLGCLLEKQRTTPDQYPLTLNALRLACNQSTNRDPVVDYDDTVIREALHRLERRGVVRLASGAGSRAPKYRHLIADALPMCADEQAVMCVLMLRGAQTPGELKQRTERMHTFAGLAEVGETLEGLIERVIARRLDRRAGQKEERFCELLTADAGDLEGVPSTAAAHAPAYAYARAADPSNASSGSPDGGEVPAESAIEELRARVERLEREVATMREAHTTANIVAGEPSEWAGR